MRRPVGIAGLQAGEDVNGSQQQKKKPKPAIELLPESGAARDSAT